MTYGFFCKLHHWCWDMFRLEINFDWHNAISQWIIFNILRVVHNWRIDPKVSNYVLPTGINSRGFSVRLKCKRAQGSFFLFFLKSKQLTTTCPNANRFCASLYPRPFIFLLAKFLKNISFYMLHVQQFCLVFVPFFEKCITRVERRKERQREILGAVV